MHLSLSVERSIVFDKPKSAKLISRFSIVLIFTAFLHHAFFCFINTHFLTISTSVLVATELSLLLITSIFFIKNVDHTFLLLLMLVFANTFLLAIFQEGFDPKNIRNFMIPLLMIWLGSKYDNHIPVDKIVKVLAVIFLIFGLFELIFIDLFQELFNVLKFQYSVGRSESAEIDYINGTFSANGQRYNGRNFLAFLGDHRVASVFLETVNTSNFCTLLAAWGLSKNKFNQGFFFYAIALIVALLADSRFGITLILLMTIMRFSFSVNLLKIISYFFPLFILLICIYFGMDYVEFRDDFETRLGSTGFYLLNFTPLEYFGLSSHHYKSFVDQGYARLFHFNGFILIMILWLSFINFKVVKEGEIFKCFIAIIVASNLAVSGDSVFAFKWVAIMWFLLGTLKKNKALSVIK